MQEFRGICLTNLDMRQFFRKFVAKFATIYADNVAKVKCDNDVYTFITIIRLWKRN